MRLLQHVDITATLHAVTLLSLAFLPGSRCDCSDAMDGMLHAQASLPAVHPTFWNPGTRG